MSKGKRSELFYWLKKKHFSIYMSQEVHWTEKSSENWAAEWGYSALLSGLVSNKLGVAILYNKNFSFKILRQLCDKEGRYIIVDLEVDQWADLHDLQYLRSEYRWSSFL